MADIEKVVKGLRCLAQTEEPMANPCAKCDYKDRANFAFCVVDVAKDTLELLKEQQPKKGHWEKSEYASDRWHQCSECGTITERVDKNGYKLTCNFCRICGADMRGEQG